MSNYKLKILGKLDRIVERCNASVYLNELCKDVREYAENFENDKIDPDLWEAELYAIANLQMKDNDNHSKHYPTHMTIRMVDGKPVYSLEYEYDAIHDPDHHEQEDCDWMDNNEYIH